MVKMNVMRDFRESEEVGEEGVAVVGSSIWRTLSYHAASAAVAVIVSLAIGWYVFGPKLSAEMAVIADARERAIAAAKTTRGQAARVEVAVTKVAEVAADAQKSATEAAEMAIETRDHRDAAESAMEYARRHAVNAKSASEKAAASTRLATTIVTRAEETIKSFDSQTIRDEVRQMRMTLGEELDAMRKKHKSEIERLRAERPDLGRLRTEARTVAGAEFLRIMRLSGRERRQLIRDGE